MNRTKVILSIFLMLFLLLAGLVLPSFWKSQKKEASGNKGREPAKETTETNSDTPMPEYLDFDALKAFFSDSQIASLKGQFPVYLKEYVKKEQTSITFLPEKNQLPYRNNRLPDVFTFRSGYASGYLSHPDGCVFIWRRRGTGLCRYDCLRKANR